jgi:ribosomal protein L11 methyltransferase
MDYLELKIDVIDEEQRDILLCRLLNEGFESFVESENVLLAYIPSHLLIKEKVEPMLDSFRVIYNFSLVPERNWNENWEKQYDPVLIKDKCYIRAPFHKTEPGIQYEIIIEPKMSFGTAHHETTSLMIEMMLEMDFTGKKVLDMGCGTGILAILAEKMGACNIVAVDNDEWSYENALENISRNNSESIRVALGDYYTMDDKEFDIILANINRNVLLEQITAYSGMIVKGVLLISGFYEDDIPLIRDKAEQNGFQLLKFITRNGWTAIKFNK